MVLRLVDVELDACNVVLLLVDVDLDACNAVLRLVDVDEDVYVMWCYNWLIYTHRQKLSNSKLVLNIKKNVSYQNIGNSSFIIFI